MHRLNSKQQTVRFCDQDWSTMEIREKGRFCESCQKCVVDFTQKTPFEVMQIQAFSKEPLCGYYRPDHFFDHQKAPTVIPSRRWALAAMFPILMSGTKDLYSQQPIVTPTEQHPFGETAVVAEERTKNRAPNSKIVSIQGKITDTEGVPLIGVAVLLEETHQGVVTNFDGGFLLQTTKESLPDTVRLGFYYLGAFHEPMDLGLSENLEDEYDLHIQMEYLTNPEIFFIGLIAYEPTFWQRIARPFRRLANWIRN